MSPEQHRSLGRALKEARARFRAEWFADSRALGKSHARVRSWRSIERYFDQLFYELDSCAVREFPSDVLATSYYGQPPIFADWLLLECPADNDPLGEFVRDAQRLPCCLPAFKSLDATLTHMRAHNAYEGALEAAAKAWALWGGTR